MIAVAGALRLADAGKPDIIQATARWPLDSLTPPAGVSDSGNEAHG
jgi:hypothetical protein